jgi:hypothetical protein
VGPDKASQLGLLAGASPLTSTVAIGVANLDFYRAALARSISWTQFSKNLVVRTSGIIGGLGGWTSGAVVGSAVGGVAGALIGGIAGALSGGSLGSAGAKRVADRLVKDDAVRLMEIVQRGPEDLAFDHLLTHLELRRFAQEIQVLVDASWLRRMFQAGRGQDQSGPSSDAELWARFARRELEEVCSKIVKKRRRITLPSPESALTLLESIGLLDRTVSPEPRPQRDLA